MGSRDLIEPINLKNWVLKSIDFQESVKRDFQYFHVISKTKRLLIAAFLIGSHTASYTAFMISTHTMPYAVFQILHTSFLITSHT